MANCFITLTLIAASSVAAILAQAPAPTAGTSAISSPKTYAQLQADVKAWQAAPGSEQQCGTDPGGKLEKLLNKYEDCNNGDAFRIINGCKVSDASPLGWTVAVSTTLKTQCTGTLVSPKHVFISAQCLTKISDVNELTVLAGVSSIVGRKPATTLELRVSAIGTQPSGNLAILELQTPISAASSADGVRPLCLPTQPIGNQQLKKCVTASFGLTSAPKDGASNGMSDMYVGLMDLTAKSQCASAYKSAFNSFTQLCAFGVRTGVLTTLCGGDIGAGLACKVGGQWTLVGVASFIDNDCSGPAVFQDMYAGSSATAPAADEDPDNPTVTAIDGSQSSIGAGISSADTVIIGKDPTSIDANKPANDKANAADSTVPQTGVGHDTSAADSTHATDPQKPSVGGTIGVDEKSVDSPSSAAGTGIDKKPAIANTDNDKNSKPVDSAVGNENGANNAGPPVANTDPNKQTASANPVVNTKDPLDPNVGSGTNDNTGPKSNGGSSAATDKNSQPDTNPSNSATNTSPSIANDANPAASVNKDTSAANSNTKPTSSSNLSDVMFGGTQPTSNGDKIAVDKPAGNASPSTGGSSNSPVLPATGSATPVDPSKQTSSGGAPTSTGMTSDSQPKDTSNDLKNVGSPTSGNPVVNSNPATDISSNGASAGGNPTNANDNPVSSIQTGAASGPAAVGVSSGSGPTNSINPSGSSVPTIASNNSPAIDLPSPAGATNGAHTDVALPSIGLSNGNPAITNPGMSPNSAKGLNGAGDTAGNTVATGSNVPTTLGNLGSPIVANPPSAGFAADAKSATGVTGPGLNTIVIGVNPPTTLGNTSPTTGANLPSDGFAKPADVPKKIVGGNVGCLPDASNTGVHGVDSLSDLCSNKGETDYERVRSDILQWQARNQEKCGLDQDGHIKDFLETYESCKTNRIVNGCVVNDLKAVGWTVAIVTATWQECTGTLVSDRHVIAAAKCVDGLNSTEVTVFLNALNVSIDNNDYVHPPKDTYNLKSMGQHPYFNASDYRNNIAVLELDRSVLFDHHTRPACLPTSAPNADTLLQQQNCLMASYGSKQAPAEDQEYTTPNLSVGIFNVVDHSVCENRYWPYARDTQICAEGTRTSSATNMCVGDFGAGLVCPIPQNKNKWTIVGSASYSAGKCNGPAALNSMWYGFVDGPDATSIFANTNAGNIAAANGGHSASGAGAASGTSSAAGSSTVKGPISGVDAGSAANINFSAGSSGGVGQPSNLAGSGSGTASATDSTLVKQPTTGPASDTAAAIGSGNIGANTNAAGTTAGKGQTSGTGAVAAGGSVTVGGQSAAVAPVSVGAIGQNNGADKNSGTSASAGSGQLSKVAAGGSETAGTSAAIAVGSQTTSVGSNTSSSSGSVGGTNTGAFAGSGQSSDATGSASGSLPAGTSTSVAAQINSTSAGPFSSTGSNTGSSSLVSAVSSDKISGAMLEKTEYHRLREEVLKWQESNQANCGLDHNGKIANFLDDYEACKSNRIVHGCDVDAVDVVGWVAGIVTAKGIGCAGSLVSKRHVIVAAKCIEGLTDPLQVHVYLNRTSITKKFTDKIDIHNHNFSYFVVSMATHPAYKPATFENNVAVLELDTDVNFTPGRYHAVRPVCLPVTPVAPELLDHKNCMMASFEKTKPAAADGRYEETVPKLHLGLFDVVKHDVCEIRYPKNFVRASQMCAEGTHTNSPASMCEGDFGAGMMCKLPHLNHIRWTMVGTASYSTSDCKGPAALNSMWSGFVNGADLHSVNAGSSAVTNSSQSSTAVGSSSGTLTAGASVSIGGQTVGIGGGVSTSIGSSSAAAASSEKISGGMMLKTDYYRLRESVLKWQANNQDKCGSDHNGKIADFLDDYEACKSNRIVHGCDVHAADVVGWMAAVVTSPGQKCTGTLVSNRHVMVAAKCLEGLYDPSQVHVYLNRTSINKKFSDKVDMHHKDFSYSVVAMSAHPDFKPLFQNNVGVLELDATVNFVAGPYHAVRPVCLPVARVAPELLDHKNCMMASYGNKAPDVPTDTVPKLSLGLFDVAEHKVCEDRYDKTYVRETQMCAQGAHTQSRASMCVGDFGAGLMCKLPHQNHNRWTMVGTASYSSTDCKGPAALNNMWSGFVNGADLNSIYAGTSLDISGGSSAHSSGSSSKQSSSSSSGQSSFNVSFGTGGLSIAFGSSGSSGTGLHVGGYEEPEKGWFQKLMHVVFTPARLAASVVEAVLAV